VPPSTVAFQRGAAPAVATNGNHIYVLAPILNPDGGMEANVWTY
jgi:hypothetical protein